AFADPTQAYSGPVGRAAVPDDGVNLWTYRRILYGAYFDGDVRDIVIVNWPQNDYWLRPLVGVSEEERARARDEAGQLSLCLLYWLQTEAPRPDGGTGFPGLRLHGETFGTPDGLAHEPYCREGRRIRAEFVVREQDLSLEARGTEGQAKYADRVGGGAYRMELHPSPGGEPYIDLAVWPSPIA